MYLNIVMVFAVTSTIESLKLSRNFHPEIEISKQNILEFVRDLHVRRHNLYRSDSIYTK